LIIIYKNSNIDVLKNGAITNVSDLYRKQNIGDKTVNSITFKGPLAYLACGFGIVVFDTETFEFKETYIIGPGATNLFVYQVAFSGTSIFAATKSGLFQAPLNSPNLSSYASWNKVTGIPNGPYNGVVYFGGNIITNFSKYIQTNNPSAQDTIFQFDGTNWSKYPYIGLPFPFVNKISVSDDNSSFMILDNWGFRAFSTSGTVLIQYWGNLYSANSWQYVSDAIPDPTENGAYWLADKVYGLYKVKGTPLVDPIFNYQINGPSSISDISSAQLLIQNDKVIMAPAFLDVGMFNNYNQDNIYSFTDNTWKQAIKQDTALLFDINCIAFDRNDETHYYGGSWFNGLIEYKNDKEIARYDYSNTNNLIHSTDYPGSTVTRVGGLATDKDNNLWIGLGEAQRLLSVKKAGGGWESLDFTNINAVNGSPGPYPRIRQVMIDSSKQVWALSYGIGLYVYKFDGTFAQPNASNAKKLQNIVGQGGLPSNEVICMTEDKSGDIWVGTDKGIYVFYNPESIFTQPSGWDAQPVYIQQDGKTQLLLQTEEVSTIAIDGANNKWCGTRKGGLYCFSADGQNQLYHFTTDNSPIFSNEISDVKVNPKNGEVFISTDKGTLSFQNIVTEGTENFSDVYAYPNPVKPNYEGPILIHGMINGAIVKILDVAGNFVFETTSKGGQAVWNGKTFSGQRVASGVYIVVCATSDGEQKIMTKILLLN